MPKLDKNKVTEVISKSVNDIENLVQKLTIIGNPVYINDNVTVIPVSKTVLGFLNGGSEFGETKIFQKDNNNLVGGNGVFANVTPYGFLIVNNNECTFIKTNNDNFEKLTDFTKDVINKILKESQNEKN